MTLGQVAFATLVLILGVLYAFLREGLAALGRRRRYRAGRGVTALMASIARRAPRRKSCAKRAFWSNAHSARIDPGVARGSAR